MQLTAIKSFRNTHPKSIKIPGAKHADHVHEGATFSLDENDPAEGRLILDLVNSDSVLPSERVKAEKAAAAPVKAEK